ncbi:MAG TPA: peptidyl-prolyl cis-trans isomerase [Candidatus Aminicenantes bacterium]|nr:peptidyl-prolyl cis-trans isomerase [Candidatus Aminicenantes bacterium]
MRIEMSLFQLKKDALLAVVCFVLVTCAGKAPEEKAVEDSHYNTQENEVILKIEDSFYTNSDFKDYLLLTVGEGYGEMPDLSLSRMLDSFVEEKLLLEAAKGKGMFLTDEEKKAYIARLSNEFKLSERMIQKEVKIDTLLEKLLIEKFTLGLVEDISVDPEEIREYYSSNKREFLQNEQRRVSQILLKTEERAIEIYKLVKGASEERFQQVAREESEGVEASRGGVMGIFELGQLPVEMDKVVFSLKQGQVSQVIESEYGYHIFRVDEIIKSAPLPDKPDEEISSKIEMKILNQKINEFMHNYQDKLKSDLDWNFYPDRLSFSYQRNEYE